MLSPSYYEYRWSLYRSILSQGESAAKPALAGMDTDIYELLDANSVVGKRIYEVGLPRWG
jgi:hypothetical protein